MLARLTEPRSQIRKESRAKRPARHHGGGTVIRAKPDCLSSRGGYRIIHISGERRRRRDCPLASRSPCGHRHGGTVQVPFRVDGSAPYFVIIIRGEALPGVVGAAGEIENVSHAL